MYRTGALIALILGAAITYSLAFTGFDKQIDQWVQDANGNPVRVSIACPTPAAMAFGDAELQMTPAWHGRECNGSTRILMVEAGIVTATALALAYRGFRNGRRPPTKSLNVLPELERLGA